MSTPHAKRRRLNEAAKTLQRPFKSPFRTPLKPGIGSDPPSSDPPEISTPTITHASPSFATIDNEPASATRVSEQQPAQILEPSKPSLPKPLVPRHATIVPSRSPSRKTVSSVSVTREIMQLRNEIQMLTQAQALATSTTDEDLVVLIDRWRAASRAAAEELFGSTRDRVNRMGGVGAWQEREKESKERQKKWEQEDMEAEREKMEEMLENGEISQETYDKFMEIEDEQVVEEEKETFKHANDDSFTMDMMLKTLNIDLKLIGYNKEAQRWDG